MKLSVPVVLQVYQSGDYIVLAHSRLKDVEVLSLMEDAPAEYGRCLMTYFHEIHVEDAYLDSPNGWRQFGCSSY